MGGQDRVLSFAREARSAAEQTSRRLETGSYVATGGGTSPTRQASATSDLVRELVARDEELLQIAEGLRIQIVMLARAAALLERERAKYLDLFMHAPDAYVISDMKGIIEEANAATGILFGAHLPFFVGRQLISFVARQDVRAFRDFLVYIAGDSAADAAPRSTALRMRPRGQPVMLVRANATVLRGASGGPIAVRWSLRHAS